MEIPTYDFRTHRRQGQTSTVYAVDIVLLEGILTFFDGFFLFVYLFFLMFFFLICFFFCAVDFVLLGEFSLFLMVFFCFLSLFCFVFFFEKRELIKPIKQKKSVICMT